MFNIHIVGYSYSEAKNIDTNCYGYAYSAGGLIADSCQSFGNSTYPIEIGVENRSGTNYVVIRIGTPTSGWYYQHFTADYRGWNPKAASSFAWVTGETTPAQTGNTHNVLINDSAGTILTSGSVGVGTSPAYKLDVSGTGNFTGTVNVATPTTGTNAATKAYVDTAIASVTSTISGTANYLPIFTGSNAIGNSAIYQTGGNVGIGTTNPVHKLQVTGDGLILTTTDYAAGSAGSSLNVYPNSGTGNVPMILQSYTAGGGAYGNIGLQPNGGNVGIGTTNPQTKLHVGGTTNPQISIGTIDYGGNSGQAVAGLQSIETAGSGGQLLFQTNPWNNSSGSGALYPPNKDDD